MLSTGRPHSPAAAAARQGQYEAIFSDEGADVWYGLQLKPTAAGDMAVIGGLKPGLGAADGGWGLAPGLVLVGVSWWAGPGPPEAASLAYETGGRQPEVERCTKLDMWGTLELLNPKQVPLNQYRSLYNHDCAT